ncbi:MAG: hypothetical protein AAF824_11475 [Bacteroidota bacterium]
MKLTTFLLWFCLIWQPTTETYQLADCNVLLESISGTYEGDCKKGQAHGSGKAVGTDTYDGEFKKGYPHGEGTYTWANGDVYKGEFSKGMMDGQGTMTKTDGTPPLVGYWIENEFIGSEKTPYKVVNKSVSINRISFKRLAKTPNEIEFKYTRLSKPTKARSLNLQGAFGVLLNENDFSQTVKIHEFPFQGGVSFAALANRDAGGSGGGEYIDGNFEFSLNLSGKWEVTVEMQGAD